MAGLFPYGAVASTPSKAVTPQLVHRHGAVQLVVDGKPLLIRGGELENSSASSLAYLQKLWPRLEALHLNTVIAPAYWDLIEPAEGRFNFKTVDGLIAQARAHHMHVVLLWFGSWKNSMSSYVPAWVKRDPARFPRAVGSDGAPMEILSALSDNNLQADSRAFVALMRHLKQMDGVQHTVVMVQVENEVGMLPTAREHSAAANAAFKAAVPRALTDYLKAHRSKLAPALRKAWRAHGERQGASWIKTFGKSVWTDELFTAWTEARYTGQVAARGKAVYDLPMYVNAALVRPHTLPGQYPSGGPLPHLFDIWHAAAPAIDMLSPDIYFPNFSAWAQRYATRKQGFFIPETGRVSGAQMGANALYAYGALKAMGVSPYAPEFLSAADAKALGQAFGVVQQLTPMILARQGTSSMTMLLPPAAFHGKADLTPQQVTMGAYTFTTRYRPKGAVSIGAKNEATADGVHAALIIRGAPDDFWVAGIGATLRFSSASHGTSRVGIASVWEGHFEHGHWLRGRQLNGDDTNQGRWLQLPADQFVIREVHLYRY
ncbi:DUF5597 domain-containing protein [Oleiagrimonas sp. C23AA]|uniref:GH35 family beta-galactosidase n=1 Tax=Oleiagrimonas sp. C23AA TaxID=2719047 RepID=UPI0014244598|nr:DUF5597 domain-containing protein [Oleiagrimonas sp. C23AA]NII09384.1 DUF5597 domain-containing protein [Oleiagrimonas sp. C23AA]